MKIIYILLVNLSFATILFAQNDLIPRYADLQKYAPAIIKQKADRYFQLEEYQEAYYHYLAFAKKKKRLARKLRYRLGKTALHANQYQTAIMYLKTVVNRSGQFPLVQYEYAKALKHRGFYKSAKNIFKLFIQKNAKKEQAYVKLAKLHIKACSLAIEAQEHPSSFAIGSAGADFETKENNIRSMTTANKNGIRLIEYQQKGRGCSIKRVNANMQIEDLESSISNPVFNSGCPHLAPDGETVFFTQQEIINATNIDHKIYQARLTEEGELVEVKKLGPAINRDGYSSIYPSLGFTDKGQEVLYFSSTLPGGKGGYDIWYAVRLENGDFTRAYNLGSRINTSKDEITPFYYQDGGELYYSSNRPEGYGGFDVYQLTGEKRRWQEKTANHLGYPINSAGNDVHFVKEKNQQGFFTTDRDGTARTLRQSTLPVVATP